LPPPPLLPNDTEYLEEEEEEEQEDDDNGSGNDLRDDGADDKDRREGPDGLANAVDSKVEVDDNDDSEIEDLKDDVDGCGDGVSRDNKEEARGRGVGLTRRDKDLLFLSVAEVTEMVVPARAARGRGLKVAADDDDEVLPCTSCGRTDDVGLWRCCCCCCC